MSLHVSPLQQVTHRLGADVRSDTILGVMPATSHAVVVYCRSLAGAFYDLLTPYFLLLTSYSLFVLCPVLFVFFCVFLCVPVCFVFVFVVFFVSFLSHNVLVFIFFLLFFPL